MSEESEMGKTYLILLAFLISSSGRVVAGGADLKVAELSPSHDSAVPLDSLRSAPVLSRWPRWYDCFANLPHNAESLVGLAVDGKSVPALVGLSTLTVGLLATDRRTTLFSRGLYRRSRAISSVSDFFVSVGDGRSSLLLSAAFGSYGLVVSDHRALAVASQTLEALLATGVVVQTFKYVAGRESPNAATSAGGAWRPFPSFTNYEKHQAKYYSFPSGHIATTAAAVTILVENYPEAEWLKPTGYSVVGLVGIGLANKGWHWCSDLPFGIALGYALGKIVSHPGDEVKAGDSGKTRLSVVPMKSERGDGLLVAMLF